MRLAMSSPSALERFSKRERFSCTSPERKKLNCKREAIMMVVRLLSPEPCWLALAPPTLLGRRSRRCHGVNSIIDGPGRPGNEAAVRFRRSLDRFVCANIGRTKITHGDHTRLHDVPKRLPASGGFALLAALRCSGPASATRERVGRN
jgi:hypothetical protein